MLGAALWPSFVGGGSYRNTAADIVRYFFQALGALMKCNVRRSASCSSEDESRIIGNRFFFFVFRVRSKRGNALTSLRHESDYDNQRYLNACMRNQNCRLVKISLNSSLAGCLDQLIARLIDLAYVKALESSRLTPILLLARTVASETVVAQHHDLGYRLHSHCCPTIHTM